jgi:ribonuclease E
VVEEAPRKPAVVAETAPRPARAGNDPRNRNKAMAADEAESVESVEENSANAAPPAEMPTSNADEPVGESTTQEDPSASEQEPMVDNDDAPSADEANIDLSAESAAAEPDARADDTKGEASAEDTSTQNRDIELEVEPTEEAAQETAAEAAKPTRTSRASNDPREVKRREREAALRAQGVSIASSAGDQDTTDGSISS